MTPLSSSRIGIGSSDTVSFTTSKGTRSGNDSDNESEGSITLEELMFLGEDTLQLKPIPSTPKTTDQSPMTSSPSSFKDTNKNVQKKTKKKQRKARRTQATKKPHVIPSLDDYLKKTQPGRNHFNSSTMVAGFEESSSENSRFTRNSGASSGLVRSNSFSERSSSVDILKDAKGLHRSNSFSDRSSLLSLPQDSYTIATLLGLTQDSSVPIFEATSFRSQD